MLEKAKRFFRKRIQNVIGSAVLSAIFTRGLTLPIFSKINFQTLIREGYSGNADVFSIINHISTVASNIPWIVSEIKDNKALQTFKNYDQFDHKYINLEEKALHQIEDHPLLKVMECPNVLQSGSEWRYNWCGYKLSTGNAFIHGVKPAIGINKTLIQELHMMPSQFVEILPGDFMMPIKKYFLNINGQRIPFEPEDVSHSKYFNPDVQQGQGLFGMSPLQAAFRTLTSSNDADTARVRAFQNQGAVGMISSTTGDDVEKMSTEELQSLSDAYQDKFGGPENFNKILFTTGMAKWDNMGLSPVDLAIMDSKVHDLRTLCSVYSVQSQIFNDPENKIASNLKEAKKAAMTDAVMPLLNSLRDELNIWLVPAYEKAEGKRLFLSPDWKSVAILQEDFQRLVSWLKNAYWITGNQKLRIMGMDESDDPNMDIVFAPANLARLGAGGAPDPPQS